MSTTSNSASISRRGMLRSIVGGGAAALTAGAIGRDAFAFGEEGAFNPRILIVGDDKWEGIRKSAPARWADEVDRRTSAPARLRPTIVRADAKEIFAEPFLVWGGSQAGKALVPEELSGLRQFFSMGGILVADDFAPDEGSFGKYVKRELARVLPEQTPIPIAADSIIYHSFYLLKRPVGRVKGPAAMEGIIRGGALQVILSSHDLLGAMARDASGAPALDASPDGDDQREHAIRLAVNIALYLLCSNYKDDQVHLDRIMKRKPR